MNGAVVEFKARLPMPSGLEGVDGRSWRVLCESIFPSAKTVEGVVMALDYCRARGLDVFKRPVHVVPMWNSTLRREVETVWPGINEIQTTAARTKQWAGMDEPKWGPDETRTFKGRKKVDGNWTATETTVSFPVWCGVTVYRMIDGQKCAFTEPVYWLEAYSRSGGQDNELPTAMWVKRPRGQLHKVAKAASLRAAFPEEASDYSAEEMEGKEIEAGGIVIDHEPAAPEQSRKPTASAPPPPPGPPIDPESGEISPHPIALPLSDNTGLPKWITFGGTLIAAFKSATTIAELADWQHQNAENMTKMGDTAPKAHASVFATLDMMRTKLGEPEPEMLGADETDRVLEAS